jgi:anaphase-promoting complex subunit 1
LRLFDSGTISIHIFLAFFCDLNLCQGHEPTTVAILIGLAATKLGTADPLLSKTLCLHLPSLLQQNGNAQQQGVVDVEISPLIQMSALAGLGLLHCASANRIVVEFFIAELSSPGPRIVNSGGTAVGVDARPVDCKEGITLCAGWSLGMVLLGLGSTPACESHTRGMNHLNDLRLEDRLYLFVEGGKRSIESSIFGNKVRYLQLIITFS